MSPVSVAHITTRSAWAAAQQAGEYAAPSLHTQGFIHCSPLDAQLLSVADFLYRGQRELVLLLIDPAELHAELRWEEFEPGSALFPHIYGPIALNAVQKVLDFPPGQDGCFSLPDALTS